MKHKFFYLNCRKVLFQIFWNQLKQIKYSECTWSATTNILNTEMYSIQVFLPHVVPSSVDWLIIEAKL